MARVPVETSRGSLVAEAGTQGRHPVKLLEQVLFLAEFPGQAPGKRGCELAWTIGDFMTPCLASASRCSGGL